MDTQHLRAVVVVARNGSISGAARELFMAQSTVSRQVGALERQLGQPLFVRRLQGVELTEQGRAFLPKAEDVLEAVQQALDAARRS